ncbi:hypothetical protein PIB30_115124, partial [Stylosanthes scabra]|nr:hypothetical protein [Stylosanthes scabra]
MGAIHRHERLAMLDSMDALRETPKYPFKLGKLRVRQSTVIQWPHLNIYHGPFAKMLQRRQQPRQLGVGLLPVPVQPGNRLLLRNPNLPVRGQEM